MDRGLPSPALVTQGEGAGGAAATATAPCPNLSLPKGGDGAATYLPCVMEGMPRRALLGKRSIQDIVGAGIGGGSGSVRGGCGVTVAAAS